MRLRIITSIFMFVIIFIAVSCAPKFGTIERPIGWYEKGEASWYGKKFHGRTTASGEIYNMHKLTAAHRTLPFGTIVEVTHLENGRKVVVRINDRGPSIRKRIIDLSYAAAKKIDMIVQGIARVRIEVIQK